MEKRKKDFLNFEIREISAEETYPVRHPVLRQGQPLETCAFPGDNLKTTIHLGLFASDKIVGIATFLKHNHPDLKETIHYQLRGMALLESHQKKGLGTFILNYGEALIQSKMAQLIWCNAREKAVPFYKKNGYIILGDAFDIPKIGTHYTMFKRL